MVARQKTWTHAIIRKEMYTLVLTDLHIYGILKKISETLQTVPEAQTIVIPMSTSYFLQYFSICVCPSVHHLLLVLFQTKRYIFCFYSLKKEKMENINILFPYKLVVFKEPFANLDKNRACNTSAQEASGV